MVQGVSIGKIKKFHFFIVKNVSIKQHTQRRVLSVFYYIDISKYLCIIKRAYTLSYVSVRACYTYIRIYIYTPIHEEKENEKRLHFSLTRRFPIVILEHT